jgi:hypothetical protein
MEYIRFIGETMGKLWVMFMEMPTPLEGVTFGYIRLGLILLSVLMSGIALSIAIPKRKEGDEIRNDRT